MRTVEIIRKKRDGKELTSAEIHRLITNYCAGCIPDYQMAAFCAAVYFRGMNSSETLELTRAMASSGHGVDLRLVDGPVADKHSTGGVGDTTTLVVAPLVAAAGVPVAKMSGGALGHTGGTIDKLRAIDGLQTSLTAEQLASAVRKTGLAIAAQTEGLVPADEKLYRLRHATATVESPALIASSIMSKKLAGGADVLLLDVKTGGGALLTDHCRSVRLAELMVDIAAGAGLRAKAVISDMSQPLGRAVGNSLEVAEAIATLSGEGPPDLQKLSVHLAGCMLSLAGAADDGRAGRRKIDRLLHGGHGLQKFAEFVENQGGNPAIAENPSLLCTAEKRMAVRSPDGGYIASVNARTIGESAAALARRGGGQLDLSAAIVLSARVGDRMQRGQRLATLHFNQPLLADPGEIRRRVGSAFVIGDEPADPPPLIHNILGPQANN